MGVSLKVGGPQSWVVFLLIPLTTTPKRGTPHNKGTPIIVRPCWFCRVNPKGPRVLYRPNESQSKPGQMKVSKGQSQP